MKQFPITVTLVCLCFIFGGCVGVVIGKASTRPLICRVWSFQRNDFKTVACQRVGADVRGGQAEPEPTATEILYPTETPIPWEPWSTPTRTATPEWITDTPEATSEPYPESGD